MATKLSRKDCNARTGTFLTACSKLIGRPYRLGGKMGDKDNALDCLGLVREYVFMMTGSEMPEEFGNLTISNYSKEFEDAPLESSIKLGEYLSYALIYEYDTAFTMATDIIYVINPGEKLSFAAGINAGNGSGIIANPTLGVISVALSMYQIKAHYKCQQRYP